MRTRKHYKAIAEIVKQGTGFTLKGNCCDCRKQLQITANILADHFATDNPRFNRDRFMKACGLN